MRQVLRWPGVHQVVYPDWPLNLKHPSVSASLFLGLQACVTIPSLFFNIGIMDGTQMLNLAKEAVYSAQQTQLLPSPPLISPPLSFFFFSKYP